MISLAPVLVIAVNITGFVFGREEARGRIIQQLEDVIGVNAAGVIELALIQTQLSEAGFLPTLIGMIVLLVGATAVFTQMQLSLNTIWGVENPEHRSGFLTLVRGRLLSLAMVLTIGFILLLFLLLNIIMRSVLVFAREWVPVSRTALNLSDLGISIVVTALLFAMIFKFLPDTKIKWKDVVLGSIVTALLFALGRHILSVYLANIALTSVYGAASSLVWILIWVYYSSLILLFGAAFTKITIEQPSRHRQLMSDLLQKKIDLN